MSLIPEAPFIILTSSFCDLLLFSALSCSNLRRGGAAAKIMDYRGIESLKRVKLE
jgi:hypothetical protein